MKSAAADKAARANAQHLLARLLAALLVLALQPLATQSQGSQRVTLSRELAAALRDPSVGEIELATSRLVLSEEDFGDDYTRTIRLGNRTVLLKSGVPGRAVLDFNQRLFAWALGEAGQFFYEAIVFLNYAQLPAATAQNIGDLPSVDGLTLFPSVTAAPGSQHVYNNCRLEVYLPANCSNTLDGTYFNYELIFGTDSARRLPDNTLLLPGVHSVNFTVRNFTSRQPVGQAKLTLSNYGVQCFQPAAPPAAAPSAFAATAPSSSDSSLPWWGVLLIALAGLALLLAVGLVTAARLLGRRGKSTAGATQLDASMSTQAAKGWVEQLPTTPASPAGGSSQAGTAASAGAATNEQLGTAALGELWRAKQAGVLEGVELGPLIGRGAYGRVYKGRWRGATVAVKVVEHSLLPPDQRGSQAAYLRESALSTLVSHPNVVTTYKAATLALHSDGKHELYQPATPGRSAAGVAAHQPAGIQSDQRLQQARSGGRSASGNSSSPFEQDSAMQALGHLSSPAGTSAAIVQGVDPTPAGPAEPSSRGSVEPEWQEAAPLLESWLLLEFCDRGSLEQAARERMFCLSDGTRNLVALYRCLQQVAAGMAHLHSLGIVHGDLKAANVMLRTQSEAPSERSRIVCKIGDFGLSRLLNALQSHVSTQTFGTLPYMPPEVLRSGRLTASADVYSFAMLMWELWTGQTPFSGEGLMAVFYKVVHEDARPLVPGDCPAAYAGMMAACWAGDPSARPTFDELFEQLSEALTLEVARCAVERRQASFRAASFDAPGGTAAPGMGA